MLTITSFCVCRFFMILVTRCFEYTLLLGYGCYVLYIFYDFAVAIGLPRLAFSFFPYLDRFD